MNYNAINILEQLLNAVSAHKKHIKALIGNYKLTHSRFYIIVRVLSLLALPALLLDILSNSYIIKNKFGSADYYIYFAGIALFVFLVTSVQKHRAKKIYRNEAATGWYCSVVNRFPSIPDMCYDPVKLQRMIKALRSGKAETLGQACAAAGIKNPHNIVNHEKLNKYLEKARVSIRKKQAEKESSAGDTLFVLHLLWKIITLPVTLLSALFDMLFGTPEELVERTRAECQAQTAHRIAIDEAKKELEKQGWRRY